MIENLWRSNLMTSVKFLFFKKMKLLTFLKKKFTAIVQMYFQSFFERLLRFRTYDTRCLHSFRISNWSNWKSLFEGTHVTLVKLLISVKRLFTALQMYFQRYIQWFVGFNPIRDEGEGRGGVQTCPPTSFSHVTSTNVGISPQNFLTLSFNPSVTLV